MSRNRSLLPALLGVVVALVTSVASAEMTKVQCVKANAEGQALRLDGKLGAARAQLEACGDASCPGLVRQDCDQRLKDLERVQPTIEFEAKDSSGADVTVVSVTIDGRPLADKLQGTPLRVDPGEHTFTFAAAGLPTVMRHLVIKEGQKDRREQVVFERPAAVPVAVAPPSPPAKPPVESSTETPAPETSTGGGISRRTIGLFAGGVGAGGIVLGSVFGLLTFSAVSQQNSACPSGSDCSGSNRSQALSDHSTASTDGTISTVAFVAGGVLLVGGAVLFFTSPSPSASATAATSVGVSVAPSVGPGGGGLSLRGAF
jgi:hypothetical protein